LVGTALAREVLHELRRRRLAHTASGRCAIDRSQAQGTAADDGDAHWSPVGLPERSQKQAF
jgi:hypothetical protein